MVKNWLYSLVISGYKVIWHSGGVTTYKIQVWFYPELGYGLYLGFSGPPNSEATWAQILVLQYISDILLGVNPWLNESTVCSFPYPWKPREENLTTKLPKDSLPSHVIRDYVGVFNHPGFGDVTISRVARTNQLELHMGQELQAVLHYNETSNTFYTNFTGKYWYFKERLPVYFKSSSPKGKLDILYMPLSSPFNEAEPVPFMRGKARRNYKRSGSDNPSCGSGTVPFTSFPDKLLHVIVILTITCLQH